MNIEGDIKIKKEKHHKKHHKKKENKIDDNNKDDNNLTNQEDTKNEKDINKEEKVNNKIEKNDSKEEKINNKEKLDNQSSVSKEEIEELQDERSRKDDSRDESENFSKKEISSRKMLFEANCVEELPKYLKKIVKTSKLSEEFLNEHFAILLNILHFITKKVFQPSSNKSIYIEKQYSKINSSDKEIYNEENITKKNNEKSTTEIIEKGRSFSIFKIFSKKKPIENVIVRNEYGLICEVNPKKLFKNLRRTGKGGFGIVFSAIYRLTNKKVAVKKMEHSTMKQKIDNYNEIKYLKKAGNHPNIVHMIECYEWKDECWVVMEFLEGGTLTEARKSHNFEEKEIAYIAKELLKGLAYLHSLGIVHRDLKSENIMMSVLGDIKLIDFGLAIDANKIRPTMVGSPYWMPPEMIKRVRHSYPADIWSFGISLLELANNKPPNYQNQLTAMFLVGTKGITEPFDHPEKYSKIFKDFISKCLEYDQNKRMSAEDLLKHPFLDQAETTKNTMQKILSTIFLSRAINLL